MKFSFLFIVLITLSIFFRFYNLSWGSPYFFHPDERNIAYAILRLQFPNQLNPQFFAYGSFPIYVIYFTAVFWNLLTNNHLSVSFENAILIGRTYSALLSLLSIILTIKIYEKITNKMSTLLIWLLATSVGLIQFSHFATFEMWLTFFTILLFYVLLKYYEQKKIVHLFLTASVCGFLLSIKISSLPLILVPIFVIFTHKQNIIKNIAIFLIVSVLICIITSPFYILDFPTFKSNLEYESSVATGTLPVFYTGQFYNTVPVLFQFLKVYPFILNPFLTAIFIPSFMYFIYLSFKRISISYFLLLITYLLLFVPQAFLHVKWTRYMIPTLPFIYLMIVITLKDFLERLQKNRIHQYTGILMIGGTMLLSFIFSVSYLKTVHFSPDSRIDASTWVSGHISIDVKILSEIYDLGIIPFNQYFRNIELFNFYELDDVNTSEVNLLEQKLNQSDYIILPSQRILKNRIKNKQKFPNGNRFYNKLLSERLGFKKIYQTPCDIFCKITYMGDPIFNVEETANVFDRPIVFVFKNLKLNEN